jgi:mRNA-degrading endonuclease RelE of RelBE toxin-antitoxin system
MRYGVIDYEAAYEDLFVRNLRRYASIRKAIKRRVDRILDDPYLNTEALGDITGRLNLIGCRSARIDRNFRLIFVVCEECKKIDDCQYCFCDDLPDKTVVFLTVGPHDKAYDVK